MRRHRRLQPCNRGVHELRVLTGLPGRLPGRAVGGGRLPVPRPLNAPDPLELIGAVQPVLPRLHVQAAEEARLAEHRHLRMPAQRAPEPRAPAARQPEHEVEPRCRPGHQASGRTATTSWVGVDRPPRNRQADATKSDERYPERHELEPVEAVHQDRGDAEHGSERPQDEIGAPDAEPRCLQPDGDVVVAPEPPLEAAPAAMPDEEGQLEEEDPEHEHDRRELGERIAAADGLEREGGEEEADQVAAGVTEEDRRLRGVQHEEPGAGAGSDDGRLAARRVDGRESQEGDGGEPRDQAVADVGEVDRVDDHEDPDEGRRRVDCRVAGDLQLRPERNDREGRRALQAELREDGQLQQVVDDPDDEEERAAYRPLERDHVLEADDGCSRKEAEGDRDAAERGHRGRVRRDDRIGLVDDPSPAGCRPHDRRAHGGDDRRPWRRPARSPARCRRPAPPT